MENLVNLEIIEKNEHLLKSRLFTKIQLGILKKKLQKKPLDSNERTYYYKFVKPRIKAMMSFFNINEINIKGDEYIIKDRVSKAINTIKKLNKKHKNKRIVLSGSFLFNKHYRDIDVFIFSKYHKEDYIKGNLHVTFLPESALDSLFFNSLAQISVSNFLYILKKDFSIGLNDVLHTYELLVNSILNKEEHDKLLRDFILQIEFISKEVILNPKQLFDAKEKMLHKNINILSDTLVNALTLSYNKHTLKMKLQKHINDYRRLLQDYKSAKNLNIYINTYSEAIELAA